MEQMNSVYSITITVTNVRRAVKWYAEHFDCKVIDEENGILEFDNIKLVLSKLQDNPPHLTFVSDTIEDEKFDHDTFGNIIKYIGEKK